MEHGDGDGDGNTFPGDGNTFPGDGNTFPGDGNTFPDFAMGAFMFGDFEGLFGQDADEFIDPTFLKTTGGIQRFDTTDDDNGWINFEPPDVFQLPPDDFQQPPHDDLQQPPQHHQGYDDLQQPPLPELGESDYSEEEKLQKKKRTNKNPEKQAQKQAQEEVKRKKKEQKQLQKDLKTKGKAEKRKKAVEKVRYPGTHFVAPIGFKPQLGNIDVVGPMFKCRKDYEFKGLKSRERKNAILATPEEITLVKQQQEDRKNRRLAKKKEFGDQKVEKLEVIPEPVNPEPVNPEPVNPEPVNPEPVNPEPVNPEPVNPEPINPEPVNPEPINQIPEPPMDQARLDEFRQDIWDMITPRLCNLTIKGLAIKIWLVRVRMAHRTRKFACFCYIPGLGEFMVASHMMEDVLHLYAQIAEDIEWGGKKIPSCTDAAGLTTALRLLRGGDLPPVPIKELPPALRSNVADCAEMYRQLALFRHSAMFQSLQLTEQVPVQVLKDMETLDLNGPRGPIHARRFFRTNPKMGDDW
jgi:hypothetical protein